MSIFMEFTNSEPNKPLGPGSGITIRSIRHSPLADASTIVRTLPGAVMGHPGLPIQRVLNTNLRNEQLGLQLPAGTIVSIDPIKSGDIYIGKDVDGEAFKIDRDHFYGYDETVLGWIRPAAYTTSTDIEFLATSYDVAFNRILWTDGTALEAGVTKTLTITSDSARGIEEYAKRPAGILLGDLYFDPVGMYAAYDLPFIKGSAIATTCYITIPYVINDADYKMATDEAGYQSVLGLYAFLVIPDASASYINGALVQSDKYGNYVTTTNPVTYTVESDGGDVVIYDPITVGSIVSLDNRMPRQLLNGVQVDPQFALTGTSTGGIYGYLFDFVKKIIVASAVKASPTVEDIQGYIQSGDFGLATINVNI